MLAWLDPLSGGSSRGGAFASLVCSFTYSSWICFIASLTGWAEPLVVLLGWSTAIVPGTVAVFPLWPRVGALVRPFGVPYLLFSAWTVTRWYSAPAESVSVYGGTPAAAAS